MGITIGLAVLMLALLIGLWGFRLRQTTGLPWAPVIYQDTGGHAPEKPLIARRLGLVGKPDYLLEIRGRTVPVEVKPGRRADRHRAGSWRRGACIHDADLQARSRRAHR